MYPEIKGKIEAGGIAIRTEMKEKRCQSRQKISHLSPFKSAFLSQSIFQALSQLQLHVKYSLY
jgi:hypothetical protein